MKLGDIPGYRIMNELGRGGMARVYLALHEGLDRLVAVKVLCPNLAADSSFSERFVREARIVASLNHPNIITVYDVGVHENRHYIAMEYLPGETLKSKIRQKMNPEKALRYMKQMSLGLKAAHDKGFIHRDIKPANILFRENGSPVITDFGVARAEKSDTQMTQAGTIIGTPHYMSPEQAQGLPLKANSDLYSLGVVFYEMLIGEVPYKSDSMVAIIYKHVHEPIPILPDQLSIYQKIINKLLAKTVHDRYQDAGEIVRDIEAVEFNSKPEFATRIMPNRAAANTHELAQIFSRWKKIAEVNLISVNQWVNQNWKKTESKNNRSIIFAGAAFVAAFFVVINIVFTINKIDDANTEKKTPSKFEIFSETEQIVDNDNYEPLYKNGYEDRQILDEKNASDVNEQELHKNEQHEQERLALINKEREEKLDLELREKEKIKALNKEKIKRLIFNAEAHINTNRLNEAYLNYKKVISIDAKNTDANTGIKRVAEKYLNLAVARANTNQFSKARAYLNKANTISPHHPQYLATRQKISNLRSRYQRQQEEKQAVELEQKRRKTDKAEPENSSLQRRTFGGF